MELTQENGIHIPSHSSLNELVTQQEQTASIHSQQSFVDHQMLPQSQSMQQIGIHNAMHLQSIGQMQDHFPSHGISSAYVQMGQTHTMDGSVSGNIQQNDNDSVNEETNLKKKRKRSDKKEKGNSDVSFQQKHVLLLFLYFYIAQLSCYIMITF